MGAERILGLESEGSRYNLLHCEDFPNLIGLYKYCFNHKKKDNPTSLFIKAIIEWKMTGLAYSDWIELSGDGFELVSNNNIPVSFVWWHYCKRNSKVLGMEEFFNYDMNHGCAYTYEAEQDDRYKEYDADRKEFDKDAASEMNHLLYMETEHERWEQQMKRLDKIRKKA